VRSIRTRLLIGLLAGVIVVQLTVYLLIYARIEDEIDELFDSELERSALSVNPAEPQATVPLPPRKVENPQEGMVITLWRSPSGPPAYQSRPLAGIARATPDGFSKMVIDGRGWRLFARNVGQQQLVVAAQPADIRDVAARKITLRTMLPSLGALPLAALMIWLGVSYGLSPLVRITADLRKRSHRDLSPIDAKQLPPDIAPVVDALNELMVRLAGIIASQRTFIADAAHELLTPLTALRLQAQMLARAATPERRDEAMGELQGGVARTLQLARQLLTLARHDGDADADYVGEVDLVSVVSRVMALHRPLAEDKQLHLELIAPAHASVNGNDEALAILVSNLIENSIKYSDRGGRVRVNLGQETLWVVLRVEDSGPGIPAHERQRVFDRFYRRRDTYASGSGLGLSIAKDIAARHDACIALATSDALGGLSASLTFSAV
jgi:two-component system, OmpR family, sensor kinase